MDYMTLSTDFGADSSSRFPFRARSNRQTDATERPTSRQRLYTAGVGNKNKLISGFRA